MQADLRKNYFELFGLAAAFDIDPADLAARYRDLARRLHPDKFAARPDPERRLSLQLTARLNEAFQVLKDPIRRGRYLLSLRGVDLGEETDTAMDPAFLMEQMELREALAQARGCADPRTRLAELANDIQRRLAAKLHTLAAQLQQDRSSEARATLREMQFLERSRREIDNLEEELA
ncbi:MAG: Fe-S protein assembly co-chaperone HscB [Candidatus Muproteobacteria bacterium RBG_16_65_34]|uniref:Co-chaperone protein HscB homolog n=1 Tax=Candidatus Muproteobacteria bacterium RBG_16_65_34 TaxID=1817760 RepID=A0A1F6TK83_9PROT|nr:MAG: Fe-S protein assembly co-chaperone HscB [Candidatus Muproteobacteria bacterium RBG_16_65_34]